jgi:hypothetical protein
MATGIKTGWRTKGTVNKSTAETKAILQKLYQMNLTIYKTYWKT